MKEKKTEEKGVKFHLYQPDAIEAATVKLEKDATSVRNRLHNIATSALYHWFAGNMTAEQTCAALNALSTASPYHSRSFNTWLKQMTPLNWSDEKSVWYVHADQKLKEQAWLKARDNPFWTVSPPPNAKPLDIFAAVDQLIARVERHQKDGGHVEGDVIDMEAVRQLREIRKLKKAS